MRAKSLALCSAAALAMFGSARAADLTVAEPVDYVKICDAFGESFFYSPGTDTCIHIGGYVKFGTSVGDTDFATYNKTYPGSTWSNFYTEASIQLTASSVTEYGNLTGFLDVRSQTANEGSLSASAAQIVNTQSNTAYIDSGYLQFGPVQAGYFTSLFDFGRGYTDTGSFGSDSTTDHIQYTYAAGGIALSLSIEDQRDRGAAGHTDGLIVEDGVHSYGGQDNIPDIVAAAAYSSGIVHAKFAGAYVNQAVDRTGAGTASDPYQLLDEDGWAVGGGLEFTLDALVKGDRFFVTAAYADNANSFTGLSGGTSVADLGGFRDQDLAPIAPGTSWSALASYKHQWSPSVFSALTGGYATYDGKGTYRAGESLDAWRGVFSTSWTPVDNLELMLDGSYANIDQADGDNGNAWAVNLWMQRSW